MKWTIKRVLWSAIFHWSNEARARDSFVELFFSVMRNGLEHFRSFIDFSFQFSCRCNWTSRARSTKLRSSESVFSFKKRSINLFSLNIFHFNFFFCCSSNVVSQWSTEIVWKYSCVSSINRSIRLKTIRCGFAWRTWTNQNLHVRRCFRFNSLPFWPAQATSIHWSIIFSELKSILILRSWKKGQNILLRRRQRRMFALKFWTRSLISKCQRTNRTTSMKEHRFNSRYNFE